MRIRRQGDIALIERKSIPATAKQQIVTDRIVLAYGEVTGHAHAIHDIDAVDVFVGENGEMYLKVKGPASLRHEEHGAIALEPGRIYERRIQVEYTPEAIRSVAD